MDENKKRKLEVLNYRVRPSCELCQNSEFKRSAFGECKMHNYTHLKHDRVHPLTIHKSGYCGDFEMSLASLGGLGAFDEFLDPVDWRDDYMKVVAEFPSIINLLEILIRKDERGDATATTLARLTVNRLKLLGSDTKKAMKSGYVDGHRAMSELRDNARRYRGRK